MPLAIDNIWRAIGQATWTPICAFDRECRLVAFNQAQSNETYRIYGIRIHVGDVFPDLFPAEEAAGIRAFMERALAGEEFSVVAEFGDPGRSKLPWEVHYAPLVNVEGEIDGAFHRAQELGERLQVEASLEAATEELEQSRRLEAVIRQASAGIANIDAASRFTYVNDRYCEMLGVQREELLGLSVVDLRQLEHRGEGAVRLRNLILGGPDYEAEKRYVRDDGTSVWAREGITATRDKDGVFESALVVSIDITTLKQHEADLREGEERLRLAMEAGGQGSWELDLRNHELTTSAQCRINFGRAPDRAFDYGDMIATAHPEDRDRLTTAIDGSIESGLVFDIEYRVARGDGPSGWVQVRGQPAFDARGLPLRMIGVSSDITARKLSELELVALTESLERRVSERTSELMQAEDALRQSQKMEAFGQLTGGIAHDFNNLLQSVSGALEMLGRKHVHNDDAQRLLRMAGKGLQRAGHLTGQLLAFARKQALQVESFDINAAVSAAMDLSARSLPETITITFTPDAAAWLVFSDRNQLDVAILNLVINARDAMPDGGRITIATANVVAPAIDVPADLADGEYLRLSISDTGTGMPEDVRNRVFEPFFTTKELGKGTGLGLSQVYGFAKQSGGTADIRSVVGEGTSVDIYLPRSEEGEIAPADEALVGVWRGRETVLVVDDDEDVRTLAVACLEEFGYRVLSAGSGAEGLEIIGREASIDLLLIDFAMPGMNGAETVRLARRIRPGLEVVFITGYADLNAVSEVVGFNAIVQKPFKLAQLAERVGRALARHASVVRRSAGE